MSGYRLLLAMNVRVGEWVYGCPRDRQVKGVVMGADAAGRVMLDILYRDNSSEMVPIGEFVYVAEPRLKRPELTLIPQTRDPAWSAYHREARNYRDALAQDAASWKAFPKEG